MDPMTCPECDGTGYIVCVTCDGEGYVESEDEVDAAGMRNDDPGFS